MKAMGNYLTKNEKVKNGLQSKCALLESVYQIITGLFHSACWQLNPFETMVDQSLSVG